jgi:hypothetical protein
MSRGEIPDRLQECIGVFEGSVSHHEFLFEEKEAVFSLEGVRGRVKRLIVS